MVLIVSFCTLVVAELVIRVEVGVGRITLPELQTPIVKPIVLKWLRRCNSNDPIGLRGIELYVRVALELEGLESHNSIFYEEGIQIDSEGRQVAILRL